MPLIFLIFHLIYCLNNTQNIPKNMSSPYQVYNFKIINDASFTLTFIILLLIPLRVACFNASSERECLHYHTFFLFGFFFTAIARLSTWLIGHWSIIYIYIWRCQKGKAKWPSGGEWQQRWTTGVGGTRVSCCCWGAH